MMRASDVPNVNALLRDGTLFNPMPGYVALTSGNPANVYRMRKVCMRTAQPLTLEDWARLPVAKPWVRRISRTSGKPYDFLAWADEPSATELTFKEKLKFGVKYVHTDGLTYWLQTGGIGRRWIQSVE
jgi:hypothetical protein